MNQDNTQPQPPVSTMQPQNIAPGKTDTLGIISIILAFIGLAPIGFILGLVGASKAKKEGRSPLLSRIGWIAGLIMSILALLIIIASLASVPALQKNSRDVMRKTDIARLSTELNSFYANTHYYPATLSGLGVSTTDPAGKPYTYVTSPDNCVQCTSYTLRASLENGEPYTVSSE